MGRTFLKTISISVLIAVLFYLVGTGVSYFNKPVYETSIVSQYRDINTTDAIFTSDGNLIGVDSDDNTVFELRKQIKLDAYICLKHPNNTFSETTLESIIDTDYNNTRVQCSYFFKE